MKNQWLEFFSGIITVKAKGKGKERLINQLTQNQIFIWHVKKHGDDALTFRIKLNDVKKLRAAARKRDCKIEFLKRTGLPFLFKRFLKNSGFILGSLLFLITVLLLSNMVWGIEVKGADPATEHKIRKELNTIGVKKGKLQFFLDNPEAIQRKLTDNINVITWVGVELKGTTYHLQVVEKTDQKQPELLSPRHLIAKKKAVIVDMFIEDGQAQVNIHDHVKPGQLLVSGIVGEGERRKIVPAKGEVYGETWYKTDVIQKLKNTMQVFNGNEKRKYYIKFWNLPIQIWGFGKIEYKEFETESNEKKLRFLKWELPISYLDETIREREEVTRIYSQSEAIEAAKLKARNDIKKLLGENDKIKGEKVLHKSIENGKVKLSIHFQVIENIAEEQPIIQGDTE